VARGRIGCTFVGEMRRRASTMRVWLMPAACAVGAAAVIGALATGCASGVPAREAAWGEGGGGQGRSWEAVFLPAGTAVALLRDEPTRRPEYARLDDDLSVRRARPLLATAQWPERARPTVTRTRRVFLERDARSVLFFLPRRERERDWDWWWWRWGDGDRGW